MASRTIFYQFCSTGIPFWTVSSNHQLSPVKSVHLSVCNMSPHPFVMNSLRKYSPTQPLFVVVTQRAFSSSKRWADWATRPYNVAAKETTAQEQKSLNPNLGCEMVCSLLGVVYPSNLSINITICFEPSLSMILYLSVKITREWTLKP